MSIDQRADAMIRRAIRDADRLCKEAKGENKWDEALYQTGRAAGLEQARNALTRAAVQEVGEQA